VEPHPIRLVVSDDLRRSRLTVFFRLLLALPHLVWLLLWTIAAFFAAIANWFATLGAGSPPQALHRFLGAYVRYATHVSAFLFLAANPFPGFKGAPGYPVDLEIEPPARQCRCQSGFRLLLALPALALASVLASGGGGGGGADTSAADAAVTISGVAFVAAILAWFVSLALGRMPSGLRDLIAYAVGYAAQAYAYLFLLTDRYPNSDPNALGPARSVPSHPIRLDLEDDLRRSRVTVAFRLLLALPHLVWLTLWSIATVLAAVVNWFATLIAGRTPEALHSFLSAWLRYDIHVTSYLFLVGNPFPGFLGRRGSYPVDLEIEPPRQQHRLKTAFRLPLALPAIVLAGALSLALTVAAFLAWFAAVFTGEMPRGLHRLGAATLRYSSQRNAYILLLTDRYPYSAPAVEVGAR
jgi:Domain of unknown function (DUF4389)